MRIKVTFLLLLALLGYKSLAQQLTLQQANHLASLPIKCLQQEYPNKLNQMLLDSTEIEAPKKLHPAFYGCFEGLTTKFQKQHFSCILTIVSKFDFVFTLFHPSMI